MLAELHLRSAGYDGETNTDRFGDFGCAGALKVAGDLQGILDLFSLVGLHPSCLRSSDGASTARRSVGGNDVQKLLSCYGVKCDWAC